MQDKNQEDTKTHKKEESQQNAADYEYYGRDDYYRLSSQGLYSKFEENRITKYVRISNYIKIKRIEQDDESQGVVLTLEYLYRNNYHTKEITRAQLQPAELQKLSEFGVDVFFYNMKDIVMFLVVQESKVICQTVHSHLGWSNKNGQLIFKHDNFIGKSSIQSIYKGNYNITPQGTLEGWKNIIESNVIGNTNLEIALTFGLSAPIVGLLSTIKDNDTLIVHIYGKSSKGKTTAAQVAASPFGRPSKNQNGLIKSWNATGNAIVTYLRNNHGVPVVLDEASMSNLKSFTSLIYTFAENREKERMTKEGGLRSKSDWSTTIISTAEHSLFQKTNTNEGLRVRAFEFGNTEWTTSAENADTLKQGLLSHYGYAGIEFVRYLQTIGIDKVVERCKAWKEKCEETLEHSVFLSRISEKFGIILATAELANESLGLSMNLDNIMSVLYMVEKEIVDEQNQADKAYQFLLEKLISNYDCFLSDDRPFKGKECWGKIVYDTPQYEVSILKHKFNELMTEAGISDPKVVLHEWKEKKYLKTEKNKLTNRSKIVEENERENLGLDSKKPGSKGEDVVYKILFGSAELNRFGIRKLLANEDIQYAKRPRAFQK